MDLWKLEQIMDHLDEIERYRRGERNDRIALAVALVVALIGVVIATWLAVGAWPL